MQYGSRGRCPVSETRDTTQRLWSDLSTKGLFVYHRVALPSQSDLSVKPLFAYHRVVLPSQSDRTHYPTSVVRPLCETLVCLPQSDTTQSDLRHYTTSVVRPLHGGLVCLPQSGGSQPQTHPPLTCWQGHSADTYVTMAEQQPPMKSRRKTSNGEQWKHCGSLNTTPQTENNNKTPDLIALAFLVAGLTRYRERA